MTSSGGWGRRNFDLILHIGIADIFTEDSEALDWKMTNYSKLAEPQGPTHPQSYSLLATAPRLVLWT